MLGGAGEWERDAAEEQGWGRASSSSAAVKGAENKVGGECVWCGDVAGTWLVRRCAGLMRDVPGGGYLHCPLTRSCGDALLSSWKVPPSLSQGQGADTGQQLNMQPPSIRRSQEIPRDPRTFQQPDAKYPLLLLRYLLISS